MRPVGALVLVQALVVAAVRIKKFERNYAEWHVC